MKDIVNQKLPQIYKAVAVPENNTRVGLAPVWREWESLAVIQGAEPLVGGQGAKPPEADGILVLEHTLFCNLMNAGP